MGSDVGHPLLAAYQHVHACRVAELLVAGTGGGAAGAAMTRAQLVQAWAAAYPGEDDGLGRLPIRARVRRGLSLLALARIIDRRDGVRVVVADPTRLAMAAGNLRIVEDDVGMQVPPQSWRTLPAVPDELLAAQERFMDEVVQRG